MKVLSAAGNLAPAFPDQYRVIQSAVLSRTSLEANNNKFYVAEVHEADGRFRLFTHYGRVGSPGIREARYTDCRDQACADFERIVREKTGPRKGYVRIEVEKATVGSDALRTATKMDAARAHGHKTTQLHPDIAGFVEQIYDESKSELIRRIETPLGSLSKNQIERGADALRAIRFAIVRNHPQMIVGLTSDYYSLIPHRLGRWADVNAIAINTIEKADAEEELLQLMRDVYHVQGDLEAEVDRKYRALGANLSVLDAGSREYRRIEKKILRTQSHRHGFRLKVNRILEACLPGERSRYEQQGKPVGNIQELFHGTKTSNMVGILSRGLLIAPRNVPVTGYMFGKGIYFADQSTKSAQYSLRPMPGKQATGYLFLGDVALGRVKKEHGPAYREEAPKGCHSVQGCKGPSLIHNEFIVYKTAQCTLRYIAEIELA